MIRRSVASAIAIAACTAGGLFVASSSAAAAAPCPLQIESVRKYNTGVDSGSNVYYIYALSSASINAATISLITAGGDVLSAPWANLPGIKPPRTTADIRGYITGSVGDVASLSVRTVTYASGVTINCAERPTALVPTLVDASTTARVVGSSGTAGPVSVITGASTADVEAAFVSRVTPYYPEIVVQAGLQGWVTLQVTVGTSGSPDEVMLLRSSGAKLLDAAAMDALRASRFVPRMFRGKPVADVYPVEYPFVLEGAPIRGPQCAVQIGGLTSLDYPGLADHRRLAYIVASFQTDDVSAARLDLVRDDGSHQSVEWPKPRLRPRLETASSQTDETAVNVFEPKFRFVATVVVATDGAPIVQAVLASYTDRAGNLKKCALPPRAVETKFTLSQEHAVTGTWVGADVLNVVPASFAKRAVPRYPLPGDPTARGIARILLSVDRRGVPTGAVVETSSLIEELDKAALEAAIASRYDVKGLATDGGALPALCATYVFDFGE